MRCKYICTPLVHVRAYLERSDEEGVLTLVEALVTSHTVREDSFLDFS